MFQLMGHVCGSLAVILLLLFEKNWFRWRNDKRLQGNVTKHESDKTQRQELAAVF